MGHCVARVEEWKLHTIIAATLHCIAWGYNDMVFIYLAFYEAYFKK